MPELIKMSMNFNQQAPIRQSQQVQIPIINMMSNTSRNCMQLKFQGNKTCSSCSGKK